MAFQTDLSGAKIHQDTTPKVKFTVKDENADPIAGSSLDTFTLTIKREDTGALLTGWNSLDILGVDPAVVNGGTVDTNGVGSWTAPLTATDIPAADLNHHWILEFRWTYSSGTKAGEHEVRVFFAKA